MRYSWLLSVAACLIAAGIATAQPTKKPLSSTGEPRTAIPPDPNAPINKLAERPVPRGFVDGAEGRAPIPEVGRTLLQPERGARNYAPQQHSPRLPADVPQVRDAALLRVQPGEKANRLPDRPVGESLITPSTGRDVPAGPAAPTNRLGTQPGRDGR